MRFFRHKIELNRRPVVYEFDALARYNSECARGIVHTQEYDDRMAAEQSRFAQDRIARGVAGGGAGGAAGIIFHPGRQNRPKRRWWQR